MSKIEQSKIPVTLGLDNLLEISVEQGVIDNQFNWKLVRERDGLTKQSKGVKWIEWNEDGSLKHYFDEASIGRSLIMSPLNILRITAPPGKPLLKTLPTAIVTIGWSRKRFLINAWYEWQPTTATWTQNPRMSVIRYSQSFFPHRQP